MKKYKIKFYNENVYYEKLNNGLEIYIIPNNTVKDVFVTLTTKYGGCNYKFKYNNKFIKVPNGIAHFLEHKMFEQEDGIDPFTFFNNSGTYSNAYTNYYNTTYLFAGNLNFENNLNYLLDFVSSPYFTDENIEKEKGIIKEEIKMYDDIPDNIIFERSIYNIFNNHPIKHSIAGTVDDINNITKEDLYACYNTFYNPNNMFLVITGNINPKNVIKIVKNNQKNNINTINIDTEKIKESNKVFKNFEVIKHNVNIPYVCYGIKIPINKFNIERKKLNMYLTNMFNILFDETSILYERLKENNLLNMPIDIDSVDTEEHRVYLLTFRSTEYNDVLKEIDNILSSININKKDLERKKKVDISNMLYIFDDISRTNKMILNNKVMYNDIYINIYDLIKSMNKEELDIIINNLDLSNKSILVIENRE